MKIIVTGGAGFIGSWLVDLLIKEKNQVFIIDDLSSGKLKNINSQATFFKVNITNNNQVDKIFRQIKPDIIYHLAAKINVRESQLKPKVYWSTNILGTLNILAAAKKNNVKKIIFTSTGGAIYGEVDKNSPTEKSKINPYSVYALTKYLDELFIRTYFLLYGLPYVILRLANVYGPRQNSSQECGVISIFSENLIEGKKVFINGNGKQTRDYIFVSDVVNALWQSTKTRYCGLLNIGTNKKTTVNQLFLKIKRITNYPLLPNFRPQIKGDLQNSCLNNNLAIKKLKWQPKIKLDRGLKETIKYYQNQL